MNTKNWKLKDVLLIAISAVLFGVVYLGLHLHWRRSVRDADPVRHGLSGL